MVKRDNCRFEANLSYKTRLSHKREAGEGEGEEIKLGIMCSTTLKCFRVSTSLDFPNGY
jgi:hypothetical protein